MPTTGNKHQRPESRYRMLAEQVGDMISVHAPSGVYLHVSSASLELLGYDPQELVGADAYEYFHPADVSRVSTSHKTVLEGVPWTITYRLRHRSGHYVWVETTSRAICDPERGEVTEIACSTRRVVDREAIAQASREDRTEKLRRVRMSLAEGVIRPVYQPIYELGESEPFAWEALARFDPEPKRPPSAWFDEAEEVGLRVPLELRAIDAAIEGAQPLPDGVSLSMNVSPETVQHHADKLVRRLGRLGSAGRPCILEVTEHARIDDYEGFSSAVARLREGTAVRLAVDDTGAGFASLTHILRLHPDLMKLDRSVVRAISEDRRSLALARAMVAFSREIKTPVVAEGIEDKPTMALLREIGVQYGQGYLLGKPTRLEGPVETRLSSAA